ncbi:MAG: hypothetical protein AAF990_23850 [Bacteroidota bacterium]
MEKYQKPHRLEEVLALIQLLARHKNTYRSERGVEADLKRKPQSAASWLALIREHPEFFRYDPSLGKKYNISLLMRHQKKQSTTDEGSILSVEETKMVLDTAILIHAKHKTAPAAPEIAAPEAHTKVKNDVFLHWMEEIAHSRINKVLQEIHQYVYDQNVAADMTSATLLRARWNELKDQERRGILSADEQELRSNKIVNGLIELIQRLRS